MKAIQLYGVFLLVSSLLGSCATTETPDVGLETLELSQVGPATIVPGTMLVLKGDSFVDTPWGASVLRLVGSGNAGAVDLTLTPAFVDFDTMTVAVDDAAIESLGGDSDFVGTATLEVRSEVNGSLYKSPALATTLQFRRVLTPSVASIPPTGIIFVNEELQIEGDGFLLGGNEGISMARVSGCFRIGNGTCKPITTLELPLKNAEPLSRRKASFSFSPKIAGIAAGNFVGDVQLVNRPRNGGPLTAAAASVDYDLVESQVFRVNPIAASLGQYVNIQGGGFVGGEVGASTELELVGTFQGTDSTSVPVTMTLIPEFVAGATVRYVLNTEDTLGQAVDLRAQTGTFTGTITPTTTYAGKTVAGRKTNITLGIAPVKQVVFLDFRPTYVEGLRDFGLRAVDGKIRQRIVQVVKRAYTGVNLEVRETPPTDFAQYEHVEIQGIDPNGKGLFGYDNSPGKDSGNLRLYDRLGGVNAATQQDGYDGFGGVFIRSLMGFSLHPKTFAQKAPGADPVFDQIFDSFRSDLDGAPVTAADFAQDIESLPNGEKCPATGSRQDKIACAVYVLGNLVGGTLSHEIGHSLGLANPFEDGFHNNGDEPNRLMDAGGDRPFFERAELMGFGPGVFCTEEYEYLRKIMPSGQDADGSVRPPCF
jgi:hypothetical protein